MVLATEPTPKIGPVLEKAAWETTSIFDGCRSKLVSDKSFDRVLDDRRTVRTFSSASLENVLGFVQRVFEPHYTGRGTFSGRKRKLIVSAGALHPIDIIIASGASVGDPILFCDKSQKFLTLVVSNQCELAIAVEEVQKIVPTAIGHMLLFVGDLRRVASAYDSPESLLWRDGGAAIQACSMAAGAYGLTCCPLGHTGQSILNSVRVPHSDIVAIGLVIIGKE